MEILEKENLRLAERLKTLLAENMELKGMSSEQFDLNLEEALKQIQGSNSNIVRPGSEKLNRKKEPKKKKPKTGHGPTKQPHLPVFVATYELDEADQTCRLCGGQLEVWPAGMDETEVVDVVQHQWRVLKQRQTKYRCRCGCGLETAEAPKKLISGGRYTPEVAIHTAIAKYVDHLPLNRQAEQAYRQGAKIMSQTLWDQIYALMSVLEPLVERIHDHVLSQPVVGVDETPFRLIQEGGSLKWQAWQVSCPTAAYFSFQRSKSLVDATKLLGRYRGVTMVDGASVYRALEKDGEVTLANCWSHGRRTVLKAEHEAPGQVREFLEQVAELYKIEEKAVPEGVDLSRGYRRHQDLKLLSALRDTESRKVIDELRDWMLEQSFIPGGMLGKALKYIGKRWTPLTRFLEDPNIPLDNNRTEGGYIAVAIGRRNYIGARSERAMKTAATSTRFSNPPGSA